MDLDIPKTAFIERTYAGFYQRSGGAWVWILNDARGVDFSRYALRLGSQWSVTELLRAQHLSVYENKFGEVDIFPARAKGADA